MQNDKKAKKHQTNMTKKEEVVVFISYLYFSFNGNKSITKGI